MDSADISTPGVTATRACSGKPDRSNIQAGISSQRSDADPLSVHRNATPSDFASVSWTATPIPNHGCQGYRSSRNAVPWAFSSLVLYNGARPHSSLDGMTPDEAYAATGPGRTDTERLAA